MLKELIERNRQNVTTLIVLYVVLEDFILCKSQGEAQEGLKSPEINIRYSGIAQRFNIREKYYETYMQRHSGNNGLFEEQNGRYMMRKALVDSKSVKDLKDLSQLIIDLLGQRNIIYEEFFRELDEMHIRKDISKSRDYLLSLFDEARFRNFGQIFEVLSYSILKAYFESFGFGLKRFSVSFSNDGGMDFLSSDGVYQVTSSPTSQKISSDLKKLPGTKRVLILYNPSRKILRECFDSEYITEVITSDDLKSHFLEWMFKRDEYEPRLMNKILKTIREEMIRETT